MGFSAGSASVQYHYLSPMSRGLFHGSIGLSGTALNPFAYQSKPAEKAKKLGALFNCPTNDSARMINCLRKVPVRRLLNATAQFQVIFFKLANYFLIFTIFLMDRVGYIIQWLHLRQLSKNQVPLRLHF